MNLSDLSIKRPVFATMLNVVLVIFGLFSLPKLAIDLYPDVDFPVVTASVIYPGADPESIEQKILDPLEKALNGISGLKSLSSNGYPNFGQIILQFDLEKNSDEAAQEVRDKVFATVGKLPPEAEMPVVQKFNIGGAPILNIALKGSSDIKELSMLAKNVIQPALERVDGVAMVNPAGLREREVQVLIDRERLSSFGLTPANIANSIRSQNLDLPSGKVEGTESYQAVRIKGRLTSAQGVSRLPVTSIRQSNIRISDVAAVEDTVADEESAAFVQRNATILFAIQKQAGTNTPQVAELVKKEIEKLKPTLGEGTSLEVVSDNSVFIKGSIDAVKFDLVLGALLAIFIVLIFLRDIRITIISAMALPTAVIATFAFMQFMGFTLNMMTTLALSLSIGILIDDAIIVVENIHRHISMGKSGLEAARDATREIALAVIATTLTLCAVFVPVAFMQGIIGRFFFQFGLTVAFAVLVSLFVAFTLTPMLASKFLVHEKTNSRFRLSNKLEALFLSLENAYRKLLQFCLQHRGLTLGAGLGIFVLSIFMLKFVPVSFFPTEDRSEFSVDYILPEGTNLASTKNKSLVLSDAIMTYPGVDNIVTSVGASNDKKPNKANLVVKLVDKNLRSYSQSDLMNRLREDLRQAFEVDGAEISLSVAGNGGGNKSHPIQIIFKSNDWAALEAFTDQVALFTKEQVVGAVDVKTSKAKSQSEYKIIIDNAKAADLGLSSAEVASTIRSLFEGEKIGTVDIDGQSIDIKLRISDQNRSNVTDIAGVSVASSRGEYVSLNSIATILPSVAPSTIERLDGQRQITLLSNFTGKDLNSAVNQITSFVEKNKPPQILMVLSGQAEIMKDSISAMLQALLLAVILVFIILCIQYESYSSPLVIMAALPLSLSGAFGALLITGQVMSIYAMIGIILLMGLVTKNGILLVDFTMQKINDGMSVTNALLEAGPLRLRPILMTTFAAGGGMLPVAIGHGVGGEARSPMGVAVIGGLIASTLLTLVVVPCLLSVIEELKNRLIAHFRTKERVVA
jgi:HAE1 family hydrophobic/amphiphilic exporter-1